MSGDAFEWTCDQLEAATDLNRLEARGTVRIALKSAGFDARHVSGREMAAVLRRLMPGELASRGVRGADAVCERLAVGAEALAADEGAESPEVIFARLGR